MIPLEDATILWDKNCSPEVTVTKLPIRQGSYEDKYKYSHGANCIGYARLSTTHKQIYLLWLSMRIMDEYGISRSAIIDALKDIEGMQPVMEVLTEADINETFC